VHLRVRAFQPSCIFESEFASRVNSSCRRYGEARPSSKLRALFLPSFHPAACGGLGGGLYKLNAVGPAFELKRLVSTLRTHKVKNWFQSFFASKFNL
jgi:hypothetical protein